MIGLGCMRLSTAADRDDARALAVLAAAFAAGVDLVDTADAYALDDTDTGHNEHLIARAIAETGARVQVVTKGGLTRPGGAWVPDGRARHLAAAARASRERLGGAPIDLYLLHALDRRVELATSVRALAKLRGEGVVRAIGLSNINATQLAEAQAIAGPIAAVEVELQPWKLDAVRGGLVEACARDGVQLLAHRPLGGPDGARRIARDPVVGAIATRLGVRPHEVALAWLRALSPVIVPLPGATRPETAASAARGQQLVLDDAARSELDAHLLEVRGAATVQVPGQGGEVVMVMGMPAAGKSQHATALVAQGYARLNRDERGGTLLDLARDLDAALAGGARMVVVDNTYGTRAQRAPILAIARRHGVAVRCIVVAPSLEQAQAHAVARILERHGRLLEPGELRGGEIAPHAQFRYRRTYEPPALDEGFSTIEEIVPPRASTGRRRALVVELDDLVWRGRPRTPDAIELVPDAAPAIAAWSSRHPVAATLWRPGGAPGELAALARRLGELLGTSVDIACCTHPAGPPICWCRKPLPGLALHLARTHDLDLAASVHVGRGPADRGFAVRAGMQYAAITDGWPMP